MRLFFATDIHGSETCWRVIRVAIREKIAIPALRAADGL